LLVRWRRRWWWWRRRSKNRLGGGNLCMMYWLSINFPSPAPPWINLYEGLNKPLYQGFVQRGGGGGSLP
jgi:hypothetical protein